MRNIVLRGAAALFLILGLSACTAGVQDTVDRVEKGVVEPTVDRTYDEAVERWCNFPADVQLRAVDRGTITIESLLSTCPQWRRVRDYMLGDQVD